MYKEGRKIRGGSDDWWLAADLIMTWPPRLCAKQGRIGALNVEGYR